MTRPKGWAAWSPRAATVRLLDAVEDVLDLYADHLPMTLRQIFYRLVAADHLPKDESAYERLGNALVRARRAEIIDMDAMRDDGFVIEEPYFYNSLDEFLSEMRRDAENMRLVRQAGQSRRLAVWVEAAGMVPQVAAVAGKYGVPVLSSGGFDSLTARHDAAKRFSRHPTTILHIGDYDPSGESMFDVLAEDVPLLAERYGGDIQFHRLAVTPEQTETYDLPSAPPKAGDNRSFSGSRTVQAEALDPATLASIVREGIESRLDMAQYRAVLAEEKRARQRLVKRLARL